MANTYTLPGVLLTGSHASRPAANTVANGTLYGETDTGAVFQSNGSAWSAWGPAGTGHEIDYVQVTSGSVNVTHTTGATADTLVTGTSLSYDGTAIMIEFFCPEITPASGASNYTQPILYDGATQLGNMGIVFNDGSTAGTAQRQSHTFHYRLTPTVATHQYIIKALTSTGTAVYNNGTGASGAYMPMYIRVTKV